MKIKTITCHHVYNYGASLQAYALQHYLESLGHEVEIIDFNPWFHCDRYNPFWVPKNVIGRAASIIKKFPFLRYLWCPYKAYRGGMFNTWGRKAAFDAFEKDYYHLTPIKYFSSEELRQNPPMADAYIAGSDQIWNTFSNNGKEPGYYLDFGNAQTKRFSYAASLATNSIKDECKDFIKEKLAKFSSISVREKTGASLLADLGISNVSHESYILIYDFLGNDENMISFVKAYAKEKSLKIVSINDFSERGYADININNAGPLEFLGLINNAACVIASSFHATAFSVIFQKEFYTFSLKGHHNSSRMLDFLSSLGLQDRMNPTLMQASTINWVKISFALDKKKNESYAFLSLVKM